MPGKTRKRSKSASSRSKRDDKFRGRDPHKGGDKGWADPAERKKRLRERFSPGKRRTFEERPENDRFDKVLCGLRGSDVDAILLPLVRRSREGLTALTGQRSVPKTPLTAAGAAPTAGHDLAPSRSYRKDHVQAKQRKTKAPPVETFPEVLPVKGKAEDSVPLSLDAWQQEAFDHLLAGRHVVVDAPTSAGKTRVIEALLDAKMSEGLKLIYTSPVKSLSNDKYREFSQRYGRERVGINTGDFKENLGAPIILATLETYRNALLGLEPDMSRKLVVYDEYHYLQDESRGSAWEESIILTPKGSQLVLLSASVPNAEEFAEWIGEVTGQEAKVVRVSKRPVPLVDVIHTSKGWVLASELGLKDPELAKLESFFVQDVKRNRRMARGKSYYNELLTPVLDALELGLGPLVVYAARRAEVEGLAHALLRLLSRESMTRSLGPDPHQAARLERLESLSGWEYVPSELRSMVERYGVAYHHSGMIPPARVAIESLLKEGLLRACMGTMGISLGVNFAVRSAIITDETRPGETGEKLYSNSEILQMLGRAGRRGHDAQGFSLWSNLGKYARFRPRERERCVSSLKFDPSTVLGIVDRTGSYAFLSEFYRKSLFMKGQPPEQVLVFDHTSLSAEIYKVSGGLQQNCESIPEAYQSFEMGKRRSSVACSKCPSKRFCHPLVAASRRSPLQAIVGHLEDVGAIKDQKLTKLGRMARHFPQSGGLLIASWLANGDMTSETFDDYLQALAVFCSAHFKEIPSLYADSRFLSNLRMDTEIEFFYPHDIFPEYYDEVKGYVGEYDSPIVFREFNLGAPSIVKAWLQPRMTWERLVSEHSTRFFSAGDCMMVLFRFATYLQSCARLTDFDPDLAHRAKRMLAVILRSPLDARNRMLLEEVENEERLEPEVKEAIERASDEESDAELFEGDETQEPVL